MSKKNLYKITAVACVTLMLGAFTHCVSESPSNKSSSGSAERNPSNTNSTSGGNGGGGQPTGVAAVTVSTGVKNHEQILHTMASLTGVPATTADIRTVYGQVSVTLPTTNDVKSLGAPNQVAIVKLAAEFCDELIQTNNANRTTFFNTAVPSGAALLNFGAITLPQLTTSPANRQALIQRLIDNFWGGIVSEQDLVMAEDELDLLITDLSVGETMDANGARKVAKGVCTAVLSSANVTLL